MLEPDKELPVKLFQQGELLVAAMPMPGLEPQDITVSIGADNKLKVEGASRDFSPEEKSGLILNEWNVGPYFRTLNLPFPVDGTATNVTFGNGILVISMPKSHQTFASTLTLDRINSTTGVRAQHRSSGENIING